jgi:hypothetical protein
MKMFKLGLESGKPQEGREGAQPEWFYKGDGASVVAPETAFPHPPSPRMVVKSRKSWGFI